MRIPAIAGVTLLGSILVLTGCSPRDEPAPTAPATIDVVVPGGTSTPSPSATETSTDDGATPTGEDGEPHEGEEGDPHAVFNGDQASLPSAETQEEVASLVSAYLQVKSDRDWRGVEDSWITDIAAYTTPDLQATFEGARGMDGSEWKRLVADQAVVTTQVRGVTVATAYPFDATTFAVEIEYGIVRNGPTPLHDVADAPSAWTVLRVTATPDGWRVSSTDPGTPLTGW